MNSTTEDSRKGFQWHQLSQSIPLPDSHIRRTQSELQLIEDKVVAEFRDLCMFYRVVIRECQDSDEVQMSKQRFDRKRNNQPLKWTSQDVVVEMDSARVPPFESSARNFPLQHDERVGDSVASLRLPSMLASIQKDTLWSISGFNEDHQEPRQPAIIGKDTSDDAVFKEPHQTFIIDEDTSNAFVFEMDW
jgi:hypothetical protein